MSAGSAGSAGRAPGFRTTVSNRGSEIERVHARVFAFAQENAFSTGDARDINLALDELLAKIARYAHPERTEHEVDIELELAENELALSISDDGVAFDPFAPGASDASLEEQAIGADGLRIVPHLVDEASYVRRSGKNVVTLIKVVSETHRGD